MIKLVGQKQKCSKFSHYPTALRTFLPLAPNSVNMQDKREKALTSPFIQ